MRRAIVIGGGGPAAGIAIGALYKLAEADIKFDVWSLSCIGAWVGIVYNQFPGPETRKAHESWKFWCNVFREDKVYRNFPVNTAFGPDLAQTARAYAKFFLNRENLRHLVLPSEILKVARDGLKLMVDPDRWNEGDLNAYTLSFAAAHPVTRLLTSLEWLTEQNGRSRIHYPEASFAKHLRFGNLYKPDSPMIYHNAFNLSKQEQTLFSNKNHKYARIDFRTLCACSALPYVEETVEIDGDTYSEGALIHTMNFEQLLENHPDLEEIWLVRIVDVKQVRKPRTLTDNFANLIMMLAGSLGEANVDGFRLKAEAWGGRIIEIPVPSSITYDWNHSNLQLGAKEGYHATEAVINEYITGLTKPGPQPW